jgi:hypothetical protein
VAVAIIVALVLLGSVGLFALQRVLRSDAERSQPAPNARESGFLAWVARLIGGEGKAH